ncbi:DNA repair protein RAD51 homolog 3-like isoform X2 [Tubulanus polymorphus]|uniref:DNA repair protein RAD51 homolog 3-like isoform X2 n=1 Tax=Tubulanus polymorphus TaxID=672921 RepID=UPI003DA3FD26
MKLTKAGFTTVNDLLDIKPLELSKEIGITNEEALDILKLARGDSSSDDECRLQSRSCTALEMLQDERQTQCIVTFSEAIDSILGGGIPLTKITEICGAPGVGKTQMCMQLCVDVQLPERFGGIEGEAIFIDTEGSFIVERLVTIAKSTIAHCNATEECRDFNLESVLKAVYCFRCHDYIELVALIHTLPDFLKEHSKVKLIVVDSIAFHFRHDFDDLSLRTRLLNGLSQSFIKLAALQKLSVVLTNQMTTKISPAHPGGSYLVPALGESWGHACTIRLILHWENKTRYATLYKSPSMAEATVPYQITMGGIRDIESNSIENNGHPPKKKARIDNN